MVAGHNATLPCLFEIIKYAVVVKMGAEYLIPWRSLATRVSDLLMSSEPIFPRGPCCFQPAVVNMSARSSSQGVQMALESKMTSVHKNLLGAPEGKVNVVFVDDVNLPARDAFGSQPPLELLRQLVSGMRGMMTVVCFWRRETEYLRQECVLLIL